MSLFRKKQKTIKEKIKKGNYEDFDMDMDDFDNIDFGIGDLDDQITSKKRNPITSVRKGILKGITSHLLDFRRHKREILKHFPDLVSDTLDIIDDATGSIADQFRETARGSKSDVRDIVQGIDRLVPSKYARLKNKTERAAQRLRDNPLEGDVSPERAQEDSIAKTLEDVFAATNAGDDYRQKRQEAQYVVSEKLQSERHRQTTFQLGKIQEGIAIGNAFSAKINTAFQKKLLELQFRSYYVQANTLLAIKEYSATTKSLLAGILKNTGLPDYVKTTEMDRLKKAARSEIYGLAKDKLFSRSRYFKSLSSEVNERMKGINLGTVSEILQNLEVMNETGTDFTEYASQLVTSEMIMPGITGKIIRKAMKRYVGKDSDRYRKVIDIFAGLQNPEKVGTDLADKIEELQYDESFVKSGLAKILSPAIDVLRAASSRNPTKVKLRNDEDLMSAAAYNKLTQLSITKIIPGYLARILQQTERTANANPSVSLPEMTEFNPYTGDFLRSSKMSKVLTSKFKKETQTEESANAYMEVGRALSETAEGQTAKSETYLTIKAGIRPLLKQLEDARKAIGMLYKTNRENLKANKENKDDLTKPKLPTVYELESSEDKNIITKEIDALIKNLQEFKKNYIDNRSSIYSFPYSEYYQYESDATYIMNRIGDYSRTLKQDVSVRSGYFGKETAFSKILETKVGNHASLERKMYRITKSEENFSESDSTLLARFVAAADSQGVIVKDYKSYIKKGSFRDILELRYGFTPDEINRLSTLIQSSEINKNPEALATAVSLAVKARETQSTGATYAESMLENIVEGNRHMKNQGYDFDYADNSVEQRSSGFVRNLGKTIEGIAKKNDLRFWQTQLLTNVQSKSTRERFDAVMKELDPQTRDKLLQYLHDKGNVSNIENLVNQIIIKFKDYRGRGIGDIFSEGLGTEEEIPSAESTFSSDVNLKFIHGKYSLRNDNKGYRQHDTGAAEAISQLEANKAWTYKNDPNQRMHVGPMAQDVQKHLGNAVAPDGKKIDIPSMFGVVNMAIKDVYQEVKSYQNATANAIKNLIGTSSAYYTADLSIKGLKGKSIKDIFEKSTNVENIISAVGASKKKVEKLLEQGKDEFGRRFTAIKGGAAERKAQLKEQIAQVRGKQPIRTAANRVNQTFQNLATTISENENLKGGFLDKAASRIAKDTDAIINANSSEERTDALSDMLVTLIAGGVEKVGEGGRFVHRHTVARIISKTVHYTKSIKGVGCLSNVYLGKQDLQNPVLFSRNYTTTDTSEMYFDAKTGKRIVSACHIKGAVAHYNGGLIFTNEEIKEHGLYVLDANGHPIKLGGLKFMAALGVNAAMRVGKFAIKKLFKNPVSQKVAKLFGKVTNPITKRLGLTGRAGWLHATVETLKGNNELTPYLTNKIDSWRNGESRIPIIGRHINKYGAMAKDAFYGTMHDEEGYYDEGNVANRQHENDIIKARRHFENVASKDTTDKNDNRYLQAVDKITRKHISVAEKKHLINMLHVRHYGIEHPNFHGINLHGKTRKVRRPRTFAGHVRRMAGYGMLGAAGVATLPVTGPLAALYGGYKLKKNYRKIPGWVGHHAAGAGIAGIHGAARVGEAGLHGVAAMMGMPFSPEAMRYAQDRIKPKDAQEKEINDVAKSLEEAHKKEDKEDKKHVPFDDTKINGKEVRRGGVRDMLYRMKNRGKHSITKVVDMVKKHKTSAGLGILGILGLIAGGIDKLRHVFDFGVDALKMLYKIPKMFSVLGKTIKWGFKGLGFALKYGWKGAKLLGKGALGAGKKIWQGGKWVLKKFGKGGEAADGAEVAEGAEGAEAGVAGAEGAAGIGMLGSGAAVLGAGAAGYAVGKYVANPLINRATKALTGGKDTSLGEALYHGLHPTIAPDHYKKLRDNKNAPFGIRINNPGYIKDWPPEPHLPKVKGFVKFPHSMDGIMGLAMTLKYYITKGYDTISKLVSKLSMPSMAVSPRSLIDSITYSSGISPTVTLNGGDANTIDKLLTGVIVGMNGKLYYSPMTITTAAKTVSSETNLKILNVSSAKKTLNKLSGNDGPKGSANAAAKKKAKKKAAGGSMWTNFLSDLGIKSTTANGAATTVSYVKQANKWGTPRTNPSGMKGYTPSNPQTQMVRTQNLSLSQKQVKQKIESISRANGFDTQYLLVVAAHESGFQPNAKNSEGSASGLYQYIDQTWQGKLQQYAGVYHLSQNASPFDIKASTLVAGASVESDAQMMGQIKSPVTYLDTYLIHFFGTGAGPQFMHAMLKNPNTVSTNLFSQQAQWNPEFFYDGSQALSLKGTYEAIGASFDTAAKSFGLKGRSTDIIGSHGAKAPKTKKASSKLKKSVADIVKQSKGVKKATKLAAAGIAAGGSTAALAKHFMAPKAAKGKTAGGLPTTTMGLPVVGAANNLMPTPTEVTHATQHKTAVAKTHVSTPTVANMGDEHQKLVSRPIVKGVDNASVQTHHLNNISASNDEIKAVLHRQLLIQTRSMEYLKEISVHMGRSATGASRTKNAPQIQNTHIERPVEPRPVVHLRKVDKLL